MAEKRNDSVQRICAVGYINKDVPTLEGMQKMIQIYHTKGIDMVELGCFLSNLANI